jgi:hypothetical protein
MHQVARGIATRAVTDAVRLLGRLLDDLAAARRRLRLDYDRSRR